MELLGYIATLIAVIGTSGLAPASLAILAKTFGEPRPTSFELLTIFFLSVCAVWLGMIYSKLFNLDQRRTSEVKKGEDKPPEAAAS